MQAEAQSDDIEHSAVDDKRLLIVESEFGKVLRYARVKVTLSRLLCAKPGIVAN